MPQHRSAYPHTRLESEDKRDSTACETELGVVSVICPLHTGLLVVSVPPDWLERELWSSCRAEAIGLEVDTCPRVPFLLPVEPHLPRLSRSSPNFRACLSGMQNFFEQADDV